MAGKWKDPYYVRIYELARSGLSETKIAEALGVSPATFASWKSQKQGVRDALDRARTSPDGMPETNFGEYVYNRLPSHLQELWDEINLCDKVRNGLARLESLLQRAGKQARQHLFLYALVDSNFNPSEACRKVNIKRATFDYWRVSDPDFAQMMEEIQWHKKNFFEGALVKGVAEGDTALIIFANKTQNRDRGYGDRLQINGNLNQSHSLKQPTPQSEELITLENLDLPPDVLITIRDHIAKKQQKLLEHKELDNDA